jgi:hypothetical protein
MEDRIEMGLDPLGRPNKLSAVAVDDSYPQYIVENQDKYADLIKSWN